MWATLQSMKTAMSYIDNVQSCAIGIEDGISPDCYPMIRLVPVRFTPGKPYDQRTAEVQVYFGMDINKSEGLENVYEALLEMEADIIKVIKANDGKYIETVTDEDRLDTYKLMFIRFELNAARPVVS